MTKHVRWYVNTGKWYPTREEWLKLMSSIAEDEAERVNKFFYKDDAKSALIGRALIRKFVSYAIGKPSNEIKLTRNQYGRPEVCADYSKPRMFDFNVSHSGDFCVLAGIFGHGNERDPSPLITVGVDVTKIVKKETKPELDRFLDLMSRREFLPPEWDLVSGVSDDTQKCINFTRLWCLKESFIKSIGLGLKFRLNRICFKPDENNRYNITTQMLRGGFINNTCVLVDGQLATDWKFLETALDDKHLVALGYNLKSNCQHSEQSKDCFIDENPFCEISIDSLTDDLTSLAETSDELWTSFQTKLTKTK